MNETNKNIKIVNQYLMYIPHTLECIGKRLYDNLDLNDEEFDEKKLSCICGLNRVRKFFREKLIEVETLAGCEWPECVGKEECLEQCRLKEKS